MISKAFFTFICAISFLACLAQPGEDTSREEHPLSANKLVLKVDLANAVNPSDPSALLSIEYQFRTWVSFTQEVGMVTGIRGEHSEGPHYAGYKLREELRLYVDPGLAGDALGYVSFNATYRHLNLDENVTLGYDCWSDFMGSCEYLKFGESNLKSHRYGGTIRLGLARPVTNRLVMEADVGLGLSYMTLNRQENRDVTFFYPNNYLFDEQKGWHIQPSFSAKIGYVLSKGAK